MKKLMLLLVCCAVMGLLISPAFADVLPGGSSVSGNFTVNGNFTHDGVLGDMTVKNGTMVLDGAISVGGSATFSANRNANSQDINFIFGDIDGGAGAFRQILWKAAAQEFRLTGDTQINGVLQTQSDLEVAGTGTMQVLEITGGSDLSEQFDVTSSGKVKPGMVVCIDTTEPGKLKTSSQPYDRTVAGIISGAGGLKTGMLMGQQGSIAHGSYPVALTGRVYCKVDATQAAINPGDLLTTSSTPGHAMKVLDHQKAQGAIIGKAMTPLAQGETGLVLVLVSLH